MNCPNCGHVIIDAEQVDCEYYSGCYYDTMEGTCDHCGKTYRWNEKFVFSCFENVEEVTGE